MGRRIYRKNLRNKRKKNDNSIIHTETLNVYPAAQHKKNNNLSYLAIGGAVILAAIVVGAFLFL